MEEREPNVEELRAQEQNERIRKWFSERTGSDSPFIGEQMKLMDDMLEVYVKLWDGIKGLNRYRQTNSGELTEDSVGRYLEYQDVRKVFMEVFDNPKENK